MEMKLRKKFSIIAIICITILAISLTTKTLQNDTFYSIEIGKKLIENGVIKTLSEGKDLFSWHELNYTYPHWLYDLGIGAIYNGFGLTGVYVSTVIFSCILGILIYFVGIKLTKNELTSFVLTIATMVILRPYIAARAQLVTFILFLLEIYFIEKFINSKNKKTLYAVGLFLISVLIANIHSAVWPFFFILLLPYIAEFVISKIILNKEIDCRIEFVKEKSKLEAEKKLILIGIFCFLGGLITPIGAVPYTYLFKTLLGTSTIHIQEHLPMVLAQNLYAIIIFAIYFGLLIFSKIKLRLKDLFLTLGLMTLAIFTQRQFSMFMLLGGISINIWLSEIFFNDISKYNDYLKFFTRKLGIAIILIFILFYSGIFFIYNKNAEYIDTNLYPEKASEWIISNLNVDEVKLYNEYDFGSYLLFKGIPVFIDSRADLYTPEFNEGVEIDEDFFAASGLTVHYENIFEKYDITHIMIYNNSVLNIFLKQDKNYKLLYIDNSVVIYERMK